jgi:hypothetical protein
MLGTSAEAGVSTFVDSMTASNTLAILLLFGVAVGIFVIFGSSVSCDGLRIFGCPTDLLGFSFLAVFSVSLVRFGTSVVLVFSCTIITDGFGTSTNPPLASAGAGNSGSTAEEGPSVSFGTLAASMYLGRCVKTLIFFPFGVADMLEVAAFVFFPYFREG